MSWHLRRLWLIVDDAAHFHLEFLSELVSLCLLLGALELFNLGIQIEVAGISLADEQACPFIGLILCLLQLFVHILDLVVVELHMEILHVCIALHELVVHLKIFCTTLDETFLLIHDHHLCKLLVDVSLEHLVLGHDAPGCELVASLVLLESFFLQLRDLGLHCFGFQLSHRRLPFVHKKAPGPVYLRRRFAGLIQW